jgi:hypothetical protein
VIGLTDDVKLIITSQLTCYSGFPYFKYEGESVNRSQMDIKCKTCDIQTREKKPPALIHMSHCFTNVSKSAA